MFTPSSFSRGRRLFAQALLFTSTLALSAGWTSSVAASAASVSRGEFLRVAVRMLHVGVANDVTLPYTNVPSVLAPFVRTAEKHGALAVFAPEGSTIDLQRTITRGEALRVVQALLDEQPTQALTRSFSDVTTADDQAAVALALEQAWMRPYRTTFFGVAKPLLPMEEMLLLRRALSGAGVTVESPTPQTIHVNVTPNQGLPKEDILDSVWQLLNEQYLYNERIKSDEAGYGTIESLVDSLKDPYTVFFRPSSAQNFQQQLQGEVTGIGAQVEQKGDTLVIVAPLPNSPAEKAGLQPGDAILSVNGESLAGMTYEDAVDKVRGPKGTTANLHIQRNGTEMDVSVVRDLVRIDDMKVTMQGDVAVITLRQFGQPTDDNFRSQMRDLAAKNPRAIILDLRNNPGGLLDAAGVVASVFLPDRSPYVLIKTRDSTETERTDGDPLFGKDVRMIVLVNKGSASASEIVAGALQDAQRAVIVGDVTFGKGTVQQVVNFSDGSSLKMTIAEWRTPLDRKIDGVGVTPDVSISSTTTGVDAQMNRALELLR